jgi:hypothetical protein
MLPSLRKVYQYQRRKRLERSKALTIALGIVCPDGIVIGADSEISGPGDLKYEESKVYHSSHPAGWSLLFTYAGDVSLYKEARNKILRRFIELEPSPSSLELACDDVFLSMGRQIHHYDGSHGVDLEMLWALSCPGFEPRLLVFNGTGLYWGRGVHICGCGDASLSHYLYDALYDGTLALDKAVRAAIYLISRSKKYIGGIGGEMIVSTLVAGGTHDILPHEVLRIEAEMLERERRGLKDIIGLL